MGQLPFLFRICTLHRSISLLSVKLHPVLEFGFYNFMHTTSRKVFFRSYSMPREHYFFRFGIQILNVKCSKQISKITFSIFTSRFFHFSLWKKHPSGWPEDSQMVTSWFPTKSNFMRCLIFETRCERSIQNVNWILHCITPKFLRQECIRQNTSNYLNDALVSSFRYRSLSRRVRRSHGHLNYSISHVTIHCCVLYSSITV